MPPPRKYAPDGSDQLPASAERFAAMIAAGSTAVDAQRAVYGNSSNASASNRMKRPEVKRRIEWLRSERAAASAAMEAAPFEGFVKSVEDAMQTVADLVALCERKGMPREAAAARGALTAIASRTTTTRPSLEKSDGRGVVARTPILQSLRALIRERNERRAAQ